MERSSGLIWDLAWFSSSVTGCMLDSGQDLGQLQNHEDFWGYKT